MSDAPERWIEMGAKVLWDTDDYRRKVGWESAAPKGAQEVREAVTAVLTTVLADLRHQVQQSGHESGCEAFEDLNEGSDYGNENTQPTGEPCSCLHDVFLDIIDHGGSDE